MSRNMMSGFIAGGIVGASIGMYAMTNMSPRERKRMITKGKKMFGTTSSLLSGINLFS